MVAKYYTVKGIIGVLLLLFGALCGRAQNIAINTDGSTGGTFFHTKNTAAGRDNILRIENTIATMKSGINFLNSSTANADWLFYVPASSTDLRLQLYTGTDAVTFLNNGNVGIGTATPQVGLHVIADLSANSHPYRAAIIAEGEPGTFGGRMAIKQAGSAANMVLFRSNGTIAVPTALASGDLIGGMSFGGYDGALYNSHPAVSAYTAENWTASAHGTHLGFSTIPIGGAFNSFIERLRITSEGNLGIATTAPAALLDIVHASGAPNSGAFRVSRAVGQSTYISAIYGGGPFYSYIGTLSGGVEKNNITLHTTGNVSVENGNFGVGVTNATVKAEVTGSEANNQVGAGSAAVLKLVNTNAATGGRLSEIQFGHTSATKFAAISGAISDAGSNSRGDILFSTRNLPADVNLTERMRIDGAGNVGIGTTGPGSLLHLQSANVLDVPRGDLVLSRYWNTTADTRASSIFHYYNSATANDNLAFGVSGNGGTNGQPNALAQIKMLIQASGNVGIGTTAPRAKLHVAGGPILGQGLIDVSGPPITSGNAVLLTYLNSATNWSGIGGFTNGATWIRGQDISFWTPSTSNPTNFMIFTAAGLFGIGMAPGGQFELSLDQGRKPGTGTWTIVSDARLKNRDGDYTKGLKEILQLQPITYHYKNVGERKFKEEVLNTLQVGFSAQDVQKIFPETVGVDADGYLNFNMHSILVAYVNAIKEQQKMIDGLKMENKNMQTGYGILKTENQALKLQISTLKSDYDARLKQIEELLGTKVEK